MGSPSMLFRICTTHKLAPITSPVTSTMSFSNLCPSLSCSALTWPGIVCRLLPDRATRSSRLEAWFEVLETMSETLQAPRHDFRSCVLCKSWHLEETSAWRDATALVSVRLPNKPLQSANRQSICGGRSSTPSIDYAGCCTPPPRSTELHLL